MQVDRMLDPSCDFNFDLTPWIFKVKFFIWTHNGLALGTQCMANAL